MGFYIIFKLPTSQHVSFAGIIGRQLGSSQDRGAHNGGTQTSVQASKTPFRFVDIDKGMDRG